MTLLHYIIPKILGAKQDYYNNYNGTGFTDYLQLVENINNNELRIEDNSISDICLKDTFYQYFNMNLHHISDLNVFDLLQYFLENRFQDNKPQILLIVSKYMRTIQAFRRLLSLCRHRVCKTAIDNDFSLNPIDKNSRFTICIFQNNSAYYFKIHDLIQIIKSRLENCEDYFCASLPILNPYTNIPFSKSALYNIYFFIKFNTMIHQELFDIFFRCNFSLYDFKENYATVIVSKYIHSYVSNSPCNTLWKGINKMIDFINKRLKKPAKKITIEPEFPRHIIVDTLRPYYELYLQFQYTRDNTNFYNQKQSFFYKVEIFIANNPNFGRTKASIKRDISKNVRSVEYLPFCDVRSCYHTKNISLDEFLTNHQSEYSPSERFWHSNIFRSNFEDTISHVIHQAEQAAQINGVGEFGSSFDSDDETGSDDDDETVILNHPQDNTQDNTQDSDTDTEEPTVNVTTRIITTPYSRIITPPYRPVGIANTSNQTSNQTSNNTSNNTSNHASNQILQSETL